MTSAFKGCDEETLISDENAIVLAQWQEDSVWYRARIQGREGSGYLVEFLDYGNTDVCTSGQIVSCLEEIPEGSVIDDIAREMSAAASQDSTTAAVGLTSVGEPVSDGQITASCDSGSADQLAVSPDNRPAAANQLATSRSKSAAVSLQLPSHDSKSAAVPLLLPSQDSKSATVPLLLPSLPCYARWREDRVWYRCQVLTDHGEEVEVLFTDYGNQNRVERRSELVLLPTDIPGEEEKDVNVLEDLAAVQAVLAEEVPSDQTEDLSHPIATSSPLVSKDHCYESGMIYSGSGLTFMSSGSRSDPNYFIHIWSFKKYIKIKKEESTNLHLF